MTTMIDNIELILNLAAQTYESQDTSGRSVLDMAFQDHGVEVDFHFLSVLGLRFLLGVSEN